MKKKSVNPLLVVILLALSSTALSQLSKKNSFIKGDSSLNEHLFYKIKRNINLSSYDTLCLESCSFVKFTISGKNKISNIRLSESTPVFLKAALEKSLLQTAGIWDVAKKETFLLPVIYIFENNCRPDNRSSGNVERMLRDLTDASGEKYFPGYGNDKPLKCILLNPIFLKSGYH
jgi:hypothetical protein